MKKKLNLFFYLTFFLFTINYFVTYQLNASSNDECTQDIQAKKLEIKNFERFLQKNKKQMTMIKNGKYHLSNQQFDQIFPICSLTSKKLNFSVGLIENEYQNIQGQTILDIGTGVIIENNLQTIKVLTAKHVLDIEGLITFTLGSCLTMEGSNLISCLAKYESNKIFDHPNKDISYVEFRLIERFYEENLLRKICTKRNHDLFDRNKKFTIYHYPYGTQAQRINEGFIVAGTNDHTAATLGGSSGAPLISKEEEIIGIHVAGGEKFRGTVDFEDDILEFAKHNDFIRLSDISLNLTEFMERN